MKLQIPLIVFAVIITLGLAIALQGVFGINIGSVLNLGGKQITNVGNPTLPGDVATKGVVDSTLSTAGFQARVTSPCSLGKVIRVINQDGTVLCE